MSLAFFSQHYVRFTHVFYAVVLNSFSLLHSIPLNEYNTIYISMMLIIDIVISSLVLLQVPLPRIFLYMYFMHVCKYFYWT